MQASKAEARHFGIRARLLTLLIPGIVALLVLDSWNDYSALRNLMQDAYDQAMLEPVNALDNSIDLAPDGSIRVNAPFAVQAMFDVTRPQYKHLHVGITPLSASSGPDKAPAREITLLGESDLPAPPGPQSGSGLAPEGRSSVWYDTSYRGYAIRVLALSRVVTDGRGQSHRLLIQAAESTGPRDQAEAASLHQELLRDVRMVLVVALLVWLGVMWSLRPLERLRKSVLATAPDELQPLDARDVPHEVRPLVDAINHHVESHRQMLQRQSRFLADASHQLRTPLAIMLTQAGYALREKDADRLRETLHAMVAQIARSRRLCEQLLALAHASEEKPGKQPMPVVDLNTIARDVVLRHLTLAHEKDQDLGWMDAAADDAGDSNTDSHSDSADAATNAPELDKPAVPVVPVVPVAAHEAELHELLSNLVHNAIAHSPAGGKITVRVWRDETTAFAEVCDNGPGIPADQRKEVFERFRQGAHDGKARHHGAGLGLAIAQAYAHHNGGEIELSDADQGGPDSMKGLRAVLRLPIA